MSTENKNMPRLRFPGFTGEWVEKKVNEIFEIRRGYVLPISETKIVPDNEYKYPVYSSQTAKKGLMGYYNLALYKDAITWTTDGANAGTVNFRDGDFYCTNVCGVLLSNKGYSNTCVAEILGRETKKHVSYVGNPKLMNNVMAEIQICIPSSLAEQQKIAECLTAIDDLIVVQGKKLDALKEHKKGLMQQLFPQQGETTPRFRFPGFTSEWVEKKLGEVCDNILVGFPFKGQDITDDISGHPILRAYSIGEGVIRHGKDYDKYYPNNPMSLERYKVKSGDIVISMDGSVGKNIALVSEKEEDYLLIQRVARLRITEYPIHLIYQQIISQRFKDYAAGEKVGAVIAHISQKQIEAFPIYMPSSPEEQQKIAECLSELDALIADEAKQLDALKEHKKGLMQQLFPQPSK